MIDAGEAALVIVGETKIEAYLEKLELKATKRATKELELDKGQIDVAVQAAAKIAHRKRTTWCQNAGFRNTNRRHPAY